MTRQQKWAKEALARVTVHVGQGDAREYRTLCMKMPVLLMQSGLVQALAFVRSRGEPGKAFSADLARVACGLAGDDPGLDLMRTAQDAEDLAVYLALTRDVLDASTWLRRFAQSELPPGGEG
jgi:CRISPR-associated protein Cmr5